MSCCKRLATIKAIIDGNISLAVEKLLGISFHKYSDTKARLAVCKLCEHKTYISKEELVLWILENKAYVIKHIDNLLDAPSLPKRKIKTKKYKYKFCNLCKCYISAKVRLRNETCEKWKK